MRKTAQTICFYGSVAAFFVMAVAIFLFHPASAMSLNKGIDTLQYAASLLFWVGILAGIILQIACWICRHKAQPDFRKRNRERSRELSRGARCVRRLFRTPAALIMALAFVVGVVGTVVSIVDNPLSSYHTLFFMALAALGLSEYLAFNSLNFLFLVRPVKPAGPPEGPEMPESAKAAAGEKKRENPNGKHNIRLFGNRKKTISKE